MTWRVAFTKAAAGTHAEKRPRRATMARTKAGTPVVRRATTATQHVGTAESKQARQGAAPEAAATRAEPLEEERIYSIPLRQIQPDPEQHRKKFDPEALEGLAQSIRESGQKTPIVVRPVEGRRGVKYQIVAGERRYRACKLLESRGQAPRGQKPGTIRAVVRSGADETEALTEQVIENVQRAEITPMEEATAYRQLFDLWCRRARRRSKWRGKDLADPRTRASFEDEGRRWVAQQTGKSGQHVAFYLRLTELPESIRAMVQRGSLSPRHAYELTRLTDGVTDRETLRERRQHQERMARHVVAHSTPVPVLQRMVTEYIAANSQGRLFGAEEIEPEEVAQARAAQRAKIERLIDALADVINEAWSEKDQAFEPRFLMTSDIQRRIEQLDGARQSLQAILRAMQDELVRREVGEAVKRRRKAETTEGEGRHVVEGYEVGRTLFQSLGKSLAKGWGAVFKAASAGKSRRRKPRKGYTYRHPKSGKIVTVPPSQQVYYEGEEETDEEDETDAIDREERRRGDAARNGPAERPEHGGDDSGSAVGPVSGGGEAQIKPVVTARREDDQHVDDAIVPEDLAEHLRPHQRQGVAKAIYAIDSTGGFILADGTGAGKTRQELAIAEYYRRKGLRVLIITPEQVMGPKWRDGVIHGSFHDDAEAMGLNLQVLTQGEVPRDAISITGYGSLQYIRDDPNLVVICDEAHAFKNCMGARTSIRAKHGLRLINRAHGAVFASATPADKVTHLPYLARAGVYEGKTQAQQFRDLGLIRVEKRIRGGRTVAEWSISPAIGTAEVLRRIDELFCRLTRRGLMTKREISMEGVHVKFHRVKLTAEQNAELARVRKKAAGGQEDGLAKARGLMAMRRFEENYKLDMAAELALDAIRRGRKVVLFVDRRNPTTVSRRADEGETPEPITADSPIAELIRRLEAEGVPEEKLAQLHGGLRSGDRASNMDRFQACHAQVIVSTVGAGGVGVNLDDRTGEHPRTMIMITPPFTAVETVQAAGRAWRVTTKSDLEIHYLATDHSVSQWSAGLAARKLEMLNATVSGEVAALPVPDPDLYTEYDVPESVLQGGDPPPYVALPEEMTPEQREDPQPPGLIPPELRQMLTSPPYVSEEGDEGFLRDIARHNREDRHIQNKYPGNCVYCGKRVAPGGGYVTPVHTSGGWATLHQGARGNWATECDECRASERIVDLAVTREAAEPVAAPRETAEPVAAPRVDVYGCRRLSARYPGTCRACGQKIRGGDDIYWHPDQKWCVHSKCAGAGITKGLRRLVFGVRRFPLVLPARIVKGTMPWVRFRGGRRTVHSLQKAAGTSEGTVPPPSRGGKYTREEIESMGLRWVTAHPGGYEREGVPILVRDLGDEYIVVGGAGHSMDMMRLPKSKAGEAPKAPKSRKELPPEVQEELETKLQQHKEAVQAARQEVRERVRTVLEEAGISEEVPKDLLDLVAERARKKAEEEGDVEHAEELAEKAQKAAEREHRERVKRAVDATIDTAMQQLAEAELTGEPQVGEVEVEAVEAEGDELVKRLRRVRLDQDTATEIAQQVFALKDTERAQRAVARALRQGRPARAELAETLLTPLSDEEVRKRALADQVDAERVRLNNALIDMAVGGKREKLSDRGLIDGAGDAVYAVCSELTDSIPFTQHQLQRIGTRAGARLIARHLERQGVDREAAARAIHNYISEHGDAVVAEAVAQGQHLLDTADRVVACAVEGGMSSKAFAYGRALHYRKAARDLANRAVGSMAMMAQVAAELEAPSTEEFILPGQETHTGTVMLARRLGLTDDQYTITKRRGGYQIHVSPEGEDLLMRPRSLQSYGEDQAITEIRKRRAGEGWTRRGPDGEERPWKPEGMTETLRDGTHWDLAPHQQADAMMVERQHGVLIADEAGTGKTFAALAAVAHLASQGKARRVIIVVPKNTVTQWYEATQDLLAPELASAVQIASGDTPRRQRMSTLAAEGVDAEQMHIVITNHDTIRNHAGDIDDGNYDMIVLDEAHQFTERAGRESAQRAQALRELSMEYRMLLTGTPVKNDLSEFHSLVDYIQPGLLGDREEFLARYGKLSGPATAGYEALMRDLQNAVRGCMLGTRLSRPAGEGVFELRPLGTGQQPIMMREEYVSVAPSSEQREELRQVSATYEGLSDVPGATFARRAQEQKVINDLDPESNAKMAATREILSRHPDERVLIFATYRYAIDTVRDALGLDEQEIRVIDGSMSDKQRYAVQQELNDPASPVRVVLCTDAANTGQNLQAATVVVNVDLPDTPSIVRQRFARAWRVRPPKVTQDWPDLPDTVHVYHLQSETQYDIEQRHRLEQKTRQMDMPHKLDQADDTEGLGGILSAYLRERDAHGQAATA